MKTIYSKAHRLHDPPFEFTGDRLTPYSERPARAEAILQELQKRGCADLLEPEDRGLETVNEVHDPGYLSYLGKIHDAWLASGKVGPAVIPDTFAARGLGRRPGEVVNQDGYYCFDAQTPIVAGTYQAALASAHCALTGAGLLSLGEPAAYALCRPPGHHAGRSLYGGYCYLNNAAAAAARLSREGCVAVLDIDYHHGNGTQDIFYGSDRVQFVSLHGDPNRAYPFFSGYGDEKGAGPGEGFTHNFPLPAHVGEAAYLGCLDEAMEAVGRFGPRFLVVSVGVDTFEGDPLGDFDLPAGAFRGIGEMIGRARLPALFVQEGGYQVKEMGACVANLLEGFERV